MYAYIIRCKRCNKTEKSITEKERYLMLPNDKYFDHCKICKMETFFEVIARKKYKE